MDTDAVLGNPTTTYPGNLFGRGLEIGNGDAVNWVNARTISLNWTQGTVLDDMRVITDHNDAPTVSAGDPYLGAEGTAIALTGASATDPEHDPLSYAWSLSWTPSVGGTSCSLSSANTLATSVTCNDDAEVTATLSVNDGHHANPVVSTTHISVANVDPSITTLTLPTAQVAISAPVNLSAIFADPASHDTHTGTIVWGDSTVDSATVSESLHKATGTHAYTQAGTYPVTITIFDDNGGMVSAAGVVVVKGLPTADAHGPYSGNEGSTIHLTGTASDPSHETFNWMFTPHADKAGTVCTFTGQSTLTPTASCDDNAVVDASLTVTDALSQSTVSNTTVTVGNAAPVVAAPVPTAPPVATGQTIDLNTSFTDAGKHDLHTATINYGDGGPAVSLPVTETQGTGIGTVHATHAYALPGDYVVDVTVTDDDGTSGSNSTVVHVNSPPTADVGGTYIGFEGTAATLGAAMASDADADPLTTNWALTSVTGKPGVHCVLTDETQLHPSITCNDDATVTATLTVSDGVYAPITRVATLTIGNVSPTAGTVSVSPALVKPGDNVSVSVPFADVGTNDTHTATIDWGDGSPASTASISEVVGSGTGTASGVHQYSTGGHYVIIVTINDDDSGSVQATATTPVTVNSPPVVSAGGTYNGVEGTTLTLSASASDLDPDPLTTSWSFSYTGDAGVTCTIGATAGLHPTVLCNDNATVTGVLTVNDGVNSAVVDTATVNIGNLPPTAGAVLSSPSNVAVGTSVNTGVTFGDPGTNDTHTATINWGDGNTSVASVSETSGGGTASGGHHYTVPGVYTIAVTITDDNGGQVVATASSFISVFDPNAGFITGSAHFTSPPGADPAHPAATGDAEIGIEVKYQHPTDTTPTGHADFKYKDDNLEFAATGFAWLVIDSSTKAYFIGTGTVNGVGGYSFLVSVIDGSPDRVRVKVWDSTTLAVVYDNQTGAPDNASATTPIDSGSLQIHT
jgi:hypothetical protein